MAQDKNERLPQARKPGITAAGRVRWYRKREGKGKDDASAGLEKSVWLKLRDMGHSRSRRDEGGACRENEVGSVKLFQEAGSGEVGQSARAVRKASGERRESAETGVKGSDVSGVTQSSKKRVEGLPTAWGDCYGKYIAIASGALG